MSPTCSTASSTCSAPALTIIVILLSPPLAKNFGKKAVAAGGFALATIGSLAFYLLSPTNCWGMVGITAFVAIAYAPTIPLMWAIFADVADYSEWKTGRRFTGMVFATIGFALEIRPGAGLGFVSLDHGRLFPLRHQTAGRAGCDPGFPRVQRHRGRDSVRHLHHAPAQLPIEQSA